MFDLEGGGGYGWFGLGKNFFSQNSGDRIYLVRDVG